MLFSNEHYWVGLHKASGQWQWTSGDVYYPQTDIPLEDDGGAELDGALHNKNTFKSSQVDEHDARSICERLKEGNYKYVHCRKYCEFALHTSCLCHEC